MPARFPTKATRKSGRSPGKPTSLAELLEAAQTEAARHSGAAITPTAWQTAVGSRIAARTRVGRLVRGTLTIYAASAAWANELTFLAHDIIAKLQSTGLAVTSIRFQLKDLGPPPRGPAIGRAAGQPSTAPKAPLPASLQERLASVEDPKLRAAIAEAASLSLAVYDRSIG